MEHHHQSAASHHEFMANYNDVPIINGGVIGINEGTQELHRDWLLVIRRKKTANHQQSTLSKSTNHNKANRFSALSSLAHQTKPISYPLDLFHMRPHKKPNPKLISSVAGIIVTMMTPLFKNSLLPQKLHKTVPPSRKNKSKKAPS